MMKNGKIRKVCASLIAALAVCCSQGLPALARENTGFPPETDIHPFLNNPNAKQDQNDMEGSENKKDTDETAAFLNNASCNPEDQAPAAGENFPVPEDAADSGSDGVRWYKDRKGVLFFEAGELSRTDTWRKNAEEITEIRVLPSASSDRLILPEDCSQLFKGLKNLHSAETVKFDTGLTVNMTSMFEGCTSLTALDLSSFNTCSVQDMGLMFSDCYGLTSVNLSSFSTSAVTDMHYMFNNCKKLTSLDLTGFDTSNVESMQKMFCTCSSLTALDLSGFNTRSVNRIDHMFDGCSSLTSLDVSNFDTSQVKSADESKDMFLDCVWLQKINLSSHFFKGCSMDRTYPCTSQTLWMPAEHADCGKTWPEMVQSWNEGDAGWWNIVKYVLTFNSSGGSDIPALEVENGGTVDLAQYIPSKEGYDFTGWYLD
ncbi:MAG: BspA family leucine-rich repeat surface protein, partial [Erysipelotrichaceae bacterium]|nr:BspA family leucine-rich repeat surface protein [Erysipelotrichaceae bacterium]